MLSNVTAPQSFRFHKGLLYFQTMQLQESYCIGAVTPSPREKAFASTNVSLTINRFHITMNPCCYCRANTWVRPYGVKEMLRTSKVDCRDRACPCPLADRPILETLRLPSSVTSPQSFRFHKGLLYFQTMQLQESYCIGAVTPSPREKAFARGNISENGTRRIIGNIKNTGSVAARVPILLGFIKFF